MRGCHPGRWWWGVPVLALLWAATCWMVTPRIESDPRLAQTRPAAPAFAAVLRRDGQRIQLLGRLGPGAGKIIEARLRAAGFAGEISDESGAASSAQVSFEVGETMEAALRALARIAQGEATVAPDRLSLTGRAADFEAYNTIRDEFRGLAAAGRTIEFGLTPPDARPFVWTADRRENEIDLSGFVPSEAARAALLGEAAASLPGLSAVDRMQTAGGAPSSVDFGAMGRFAMAQLARLSSGRAELRGSVLSLDGAAQERDALSAVDTAMRGALPAGLSAGPVSLAALPVSPYVFGARRGQGYLTLTGYVPDAATRSRVLDIGRKAFLTEQIVDELHVGDGAPPGFLGGVSFALDNLSKLASGEARITGTSLGVSGEALYRQSGEQTRSRILANAPPGWTSTADITINTRERVFDADMCQDLLGELKQREPVQFEAGKAALSPDAPQRLGKVAALLKRCGSVAVSVAIEPGAGEEPSPSLQRTRLEAVSAALVAAGIGPDRLRMASLAPENGKANAAAPAVAFTAQR